ncbi:MAG TPA: hypothetical protein VGL77_15555 [Armatimonadota bacterium]|jgi:hypothetical protein
MAQQERIRYFGAALLAVVLIVGGGWWLWRGGHHARLPAELAPNIPDDIALRLDHVTFRGLSGGKIVWEVVADHFDLTKDQLKFNVNGLKRVALLNEGRQELMVSADSLERDMSNGNISVQGHVLMTGTDLVFRTPGLAWDDQRQVLNIPHALAAQLGDISIVAKDGATYDVAHGYLRCPGPIVIGTRGNVLRAGAALFSAHGQQFTLFTPVSADLLIADTGSAGYVLPQIPEIPMQIIERYRTYCRRLGQP